MGEEQGEKATTKEMTIFSMVFSSKKGEKSMGKTLSCIILDLFGFCFQKLLLRTVFENTENTILVFSNNCYLILVFFVFTVFSEEKNWESDMFFLFSLFFLFFRTENSFRKLLLGIVFENTENTILVFSDNCYCCSLILVFLVFFRTKKQKKQKAGNQTCFPCFLEQKTILKNRYQIP